MILNRWPKCVLKGEKIMEEILRQDISQVQSSIVTLSVTAAALALLPVICVVCWRRRCGKSASFVPVFIGAAVFLVSARVLELGVHMVCIVWDNPVSRLINGSTPVYVLYGACMAGIFEECGRYVVIRFLMKKNKNRESIDRPPIVTACQPIMAQCGEIAFSTPNNRGPRASPAKPAFRPAALMRRKFGAAQRRGTQKEKTRFQRVKTGPPPKPSEAVLVGKEEQRNERAVTSKKSPKASLLGQAALMHHKFSAACGGGELLRADFASPSIKITEGVATNGYGIQKCFW